MASSSPLAALTDRLSKLVPAGAATTPSTPPPDAGKCFDLLAELLTAVHTADPAVVKDAQRPIEDVLLRVTCGGWAGPAVRRSASDVLSALFAVGKERLAFLENARAETNISVHFLFSISPQKKWNLRVTNPSRLGHGTS